MAEQSSEARQSAPLHGERIEEYALIGDLETAALVSRSGSIDWLCWPTFSSSACFAGLLGTDQHGFWRIAPKNGELTSVERRYRPGTMILDTTFRCSEGEACVTDFMPPRGKHSDVVRIVRGVRGAVPMAFRLAIRFDYGLTVPWVTTHEGVLRAVAGPNMVVLRKHAVNAEPATLRGEDMTTVSEFTVCEGQEHHFVLTYASSIEDLPTPVPVSAALEDTRRYWTEWVSRSTYEGHYREAVERSLMVLKALTYQPTGGIVAAATTSLPEAVGGERNWDYRFCWLRDTSLLLLMLMRAGYTEEAVRWRLWLLRAVAGAPDQLQTLYGIGGERRLTESEIGWLPGYENSRPVRIGNAAVNQFQLDVFGEVVEALSRTPQAENDLRVSAIHVQTALVNHLCRVWDQPDDGIWEVRGGRQHFVYSKAMAWLALDRAIEQGEGFHETADVDRWRRNRDMLHREICDKGFSSKLNAFMQSYGSEILDASCLRLAMIGFLPLDDPRIIGTVDAIQKFLVRDRLVRRYDSCRVNDGLSGGEGTFLPCSFWLVTCLSLMGRTEQARELFEYLLSLRNDVGLLSEEYDVRACRMVGNFPQALSHIALIQAALTLGNSVHDPAR